VIKKNTIKIVKKERETCVKVGRLQIETCVLQFVDDTLFLCDANFVNVVSIKDILRCYELASELKINFQKSKLAGLNVERNFLACYAKALNYTQRKVPFKYVGLEVGGNPRKRQFLEPILHKISKRLSAWWGRFLSMVGRIFLIKSVFNVFPLFYMSFFKIPEAVCKSIINIQRRFL